MYKRKLFSILTFISARRNGRRALALQKKTELTASTFPYFACSFSAFSSVFMSSYEKVYLVAIQHISIVSFLHKHTLPECHAQIENFIDRIKHIKV